jgi:hypothetical protein
VANNPKFADATTIASVTAVATLLSNGYLEIYSGAQPVNANTGIGGAVLLSNGMQFSPTAFGTITASSGTVTATASPISSDTSATYGGTATWFRAYKQDGTTVVMDGSVGTAGCDLNLNTTSIVTGGVVSCTAFTITQSEG